jgi:branched-chain amino acid transport system permease protein
MQYLTTMFGTQQLANTNLIFGIIFLVFVLLVPRGLVPTLGRLGGQVFGKSRTRNHA